MIERTQKGHMFTVALSLRAVAIDGVPDEVNEHLLEGAIMVLGIHELIDESQLDGREICSGVNGQKTLTDSGTYELAVEVTTRDGRQYTAQKNVRVLPRLTPRDGRIEER